VRRLLAVVLATVALLLPALGAAAQTEDPNTGTLTFTGDGRSGEISCADGVCVISDVVPAITFRDGVSRETVTGTSTVDGCDYVVTSTRDLVLTADSITGASTIDSLEYSCADGTSGSDGAIRTDIQYSVDSGDACLIDASCAGTGADPAPTAPTEDVTPADSLAQAGGEFAPGGRNDVPLPAGGDRPFAAPTELSQVATFADVVTPANLAWAGGATAVLGLLVVVPTVFANSAAETLLGRLRAWWRRRRGREDSGQAPGLRGWAWAAAGVAAAAVLSMFADPNFGLDLAALRVLLSVAAAFALDVAVGWAAVILLLRLLAPTARPSFSFTPLSLLVVAGAVVLARVSGFEPAIVFGLVAGLVFVGLTSASEHARVALVTLGWAYGIGLLAWVVYSVFDPSDADLVVVRELLAAATLAGISPLPIALLPLAGLPGATIWLWRRSVWVAAYAVSLFSFLLILLPLPGSFVDVGAGLVTWIVLFVVYCLAAIGVWLAVNRPWRKDAVET
jgi:hypothetical protein